MNNLFKLKSISISKNKKNIRSFKVSLPYIKLLKKLDFNIEYKNILLIKAFINKFGKIRPRLKTKVSLKKQRAISKAIKQSRTLNLLPYFLK